jgi:hypothetical protein
MRGGMEVEWMLMCVLDCAAEAELQGGYFEGRRLLEGRKG